MDISVVVPVYNNREFLPGLLDAFARQNFRGSYEIIIVDDGSTDGTEGFMKSVFMKNLKYIRQGNSGPQSQETAV